MKKLLKNTRDYDIEKLKNKLFVNRLILSAFVIFFGIFIYANYDYLVLKYVITENYIYTDVLDELYESRLGINADGKYFKYFDTLVSGIVTSVLRESGGDRYTYVYTPEGFSASKLEEKEEAKYSFAEEINSDIVYFRLTNFSKYSKSIIFDEVDYLSEYKNLILDLRDNRGGDVSALNEIADLFLSSGNKISIDNARHNIFSTTYYSLTPKKLEFDNIVILQNGNTASSSEGLIGAIKDNVENVILIGEKTFGKGIGQITVPMKHGYALKATVFTWSTPDGYNIHQNGFEPDIEYIGDDAIQLAVDIIEQL